MNKTILFSGPSSYSIDFNRYSWIINEGPCKQSDILNLLISNKVERLIIADGFYKSVPAPWHKEILIAINEGVEVIGTSSLGALRAAELDAYGMIGSGEVYSYMKQDLHDDSEVALIHELSTSQYRPLTLAHVEVIFWIRYCLGQELITESQAKGVIEISSKIFFEKRTKKFLSRVISESFPEISIEVIFRHWFSQKVKDLYSLLEKLNDRSDLPHPDSTPVVFDLSWTPYIFRQASKDICHPCHHTGFIDNANTLANFLSFMLLSYPTLSENLYLKVHSDFFIYDILRMIKDDVSKNLDEKWDFLRKFINSLPVSGSVSTIKDIFTPDDVCMKLKIFLLDNKAAYIKPSELKDVINDYFYIEGAEVASNTVGRAYEGFNDLDNFFILGILWCQIREQKNHDNFLINTLSYKKKLDNTLLSQFLLGHKPNIESISRAIAIRVFIETKALYPHSGRLLLLQKFLADPSSEKILSHWKKLILSKGSEKPHSFYLDSLSRAKARDSVKQVRQVLSTGLISLRSPSESLPFYFHDYGYLSYAYLIYKFVP